jgi:hypothetical protein
MSEDALASLKGSESSKSSKSVGKLLQLPRLADREWLVQVLAIFDLLERQPGARGASPFARCVKLSDQLGRPSTTDAAVDEWRTCVPKLR